MLGIDGRVVEALDYAEAWRRWFTGQQVNTHAMWGLPILWWARIGKFIQFGAGLTVVLDLIGQERLDAFVRKLGAYGWSEAKDRVRHQLSLYSVRKEIAALVRAHRTARNDKDRRSAELRLNKLVAEGDVYSDAMRVARQAHVVRAAIIIGWVYFLANSTQFSLVTKVLVNIALVAYAVGTVLVPVMLVQLVGLVNVAFRSAYALVVLWLATPVLFAIGTDRPGHPIRWAAFIAFLVGFHFDLLGS